MSWTLENVDQRWKNEPDVLLPLGERSCLREGNVAKVIFLQKEPSAGERIWLRVTKVKDGRYTGAVIGSPVSIQGLRKSDPIEFGPEHVIDYAS